MLGIFDIRTRRMANTKESLGIDIANAKGLSDFIKDYLPTE